MASEKKMKVMHFIQSDGVYGAEKVILNLSEELKSYPDLNIVVGCIVSDINEFNALYEAAKAQGIEALKIPISNSRLFLELPKAAKLLQQQRIDLIHSHGYKPSVYGFIIKLMTGIPVMATCHLWFEPKTGPLKMRFLLWLEKLFYRWYPLIVAVSEPIKQTLVRNNIDSSKVFVVENGVDVSDDTPGDDEKLRESLNIPSDMFIALNVGRLTRQKAQDDLVSCATYLKQFSENFIVLIVGEGSLQEPLQKQIDEAGLNSQVRLLSYRTDIKNLLGISNVFVLPSLDEGMPIALLEATAAHVPVITTAVGDIPKLIEDSESGLIIPVEDPVELAKAIQSLWQNPELAKNLAISANKKLAERYSNRVMGEKYNKLYHFLLDPSQTQAET